jgi:hypothetical protein
MAQGMARFLRRGIPLGVPALVLMSSGPTSACQGSGLGTPVEERCDMKQLVEDLEILYGCESLVSPEVIDRRFDREIKFEDPAMTLRGRPNVRSAFDAMALIFDDAEMDDEDGVVLMPRDGTMQDPDVVVAWITAKYTIMDRKVAFRSATRLTFAPEACVVVRHEDLWNGKEFPRRASMGFLGNAFELLRDLNGGFCAAAFRAMAAMDAWRRGRVSREPPFAAQASARRQRITDQQAHEQDERG